MSVVNRSAADKLANRWIGYSYIDMHFDSGSQGDDDDGTEDDEMTESDCAHIGKKAVERSVTRRPGRLMPTSRRERRN